MPLLLIDLVVRMVSRVYFSLSGCFEEIIDYSEPTRCLGLYAWAQLRSDLLLSMEWLISSFSGIFGPQKSTGDNIIENQPLTCISDPMHVRVFSEEKLSTFTTPIVHDMTSKVQHSTWLYCGVAMLSTFVPQRRHDLFFSFRVWHSLQLRTWMPLHANSCNITRFSSNISSLMTCNRIRIEFVSNLKLEIFFKYVCFPCIQYIVYDVDILCTLHSYSYLHMGNPGVQYFPSQNSLC